MPTYFDFETNNNALSGKVHKFQTSILEADHPPMGDSSNRVATTGWINNLLGNNPLFPKVIQSSDLSISITEGYIPTPSEAEVLIPATSNPIAVVGNTTEYIYIRYMDLKPVVSTIQPTPTQGYLLAIVKSDSTKILSITPTTPNAAGWANLESPFFIGEPQAPTPPLGDCSNAIATTEFICQVVQSLLSNQKMDNTPQIVDVGGLNVNVSEGEVVKPDNTICDILPLITPVALTPNSTEYIYIRYSDCALVASTTIPNPGVGLILGTVETDDMKIISINQIAGTISGLINSNFVVGFGGRLLPII